MIDVDHQISAVERTVGDRVLAAGTARVVTTSQSYDATLEELWDACTSAERIPRWFTPISGDLRVGGRYRLEGNASGTINAVTRRALRRDGGTAMDGLIECASNPRPGRPVRPRRIARVDNDRWLRYGPGAVGIGWDLALVGLRLHPATGAANDPAASAAWIVARRVEFVTRGSRGWDEATSPRARTRPRRALRGARRRSTRVRAADREHG
jgi:hypothetical protein